MKIVTDKNGEKWEVHNFQFWALVFLLPLVYALAFDNTMTRLPHWIYVAGITLFLIANLPFIALRFQIDPLLSFVTKQKTEIKTQGFKVLIKK
jgi:uncharacterized membrane protein YhhN